MDFIKTALMSKSNWAIVIAGLSGLLSKHGVILPDVLQGQLTDFILNGITVVASIVAVTRHTTLKVASTTPVAK